MTNASKIKINTGRFYDFEGRFARTIPKMWA